LLEQEYIIGIKCQFKDVIESIQFTTSKGTIHQFGQSNNSKEITIDIPEDMIVSSL